MLKPSSTWHILEGDRMHSKNMYLQENLNVQYAYQGQVASIFMRPEP